MIICFCDHLGAIRYKFLQCLKPLANPLSPVLKDKHSFISDIIYLLLLLNLHSKHLLISISGYNLIRIEANLGCNALRVLWRNCLWLGLLICIRKLLLYSWHAFSLQQSQNWRKLTPKNWLGKAPNTPKEENYRMGTLMEGCLMCSRVVDAMISDHSCFRVQPWSICTIMISLLGVFCCGIGNGAVIAGCLKTTELLQQAWIDGAAFWTNLTETTLPHRVLSCFMIMSFGESSSLFTLLKAK